MTPDIRKAPRRTVFFQRFSFSAFQLLAAVVQSNPLFSFEPDTAILSRVKPDDFRSAIVEFIRAQAKPVDKFSHQPRLYTLTRQIGADESYDDDIVFAAVWMHDLGVFVGHRPENPEALANWDCVAYAMKETPAVLERLRFPTEKIPAVIEAIRTHQPSATPTTLEGTILRDADILEQLGATSVLRTVCKIGRDTLFQMFADALVVLRKKAEVLPGQLKLARSRELAGPRLQTLRAFLNAAEAEDCFEDYAGELQR
jgi:uncharacterized protein